LAKIQSINKKKSKRNFFIILQIKQFVAERRTVLLVQGLTDQEGELVSVLTHGGHANSARPIVVQVSQLEAQLLVVLGLEANCLVNHIVVGRIHCALCDVLRNQIKVEPLKQKKS
jgi:hypothetical protein